MEPIHPSLDIQHNRDIHLRPEQVIRHNNLDIRANQVLQVILHNSPDILHNNQVIQASLEQHQVDIQELRHQEDILGSQEQHQEDIQGSPEQHQVDIQGQRHQEDIQGSQEQHQEDIQEQRHREDIQGSQEQHPAIQAQQEQHLDIQAQPEQHLDIQGSRVIQAKQDPRVEGTPLDHTTHRHQSCLKEWAYKLRFLRFSTCELF